MHVAEIRHPFLEVRVDKTLRAMMRRRPEAGLGLMDFIFSFSVVLIMGSITVHIFNMAYDYYELIRATNLVAERLEYARGLAKQEGQPTGVICDLAKNSFGVDRNRNGRLESIEVEELPSSVRLTSDSTITFSTAGGLQGGDKQLQIVLSNWRVSRAVRVSTLGAIDID
jgi:Tfp pilus assembly protein FimT